MKCTLIYRGSGLLGPLVNIREDYNSRCTSIFKDKLGLFHLASQRGRSRSIHPCSWYTALSSCFLLIFYFSFYTSNIYTKKTLVLLILVSQARLLSLLFLWLLRAQEPLRKMKGWALVFPPFSLLPGQQAASVLRRLRCSWFFFGFNRSQRSDHGLICFFTAWPYFSHQQRECPFKLPPLYFWWNLHHMPLKGMNRLAGMLLFSSPLSVQVVWSGPSRDGGKLSNPETVLCSQNCLTGDNEGLWFFFFFWAAITSRKRRRQGLD